MLDLIEDVYSWTAKNLLFCLSSLGGEWLCWLQSIITAHMSCVLQSAMSVVTILFNHYIDSRCSRVLFHRCIIHCTFLFTGLLSVGLAA